MKLFKDIKPKEIDIISYPKSGRTWLSIMIGSYLARHFGLDEAQFIFSKELTSISKKINKIGLIKIHHDGPNFLKKPEELTIDKSEYKTHKVVFLVRDPRDIVVSAYFEKNKRVPARLEDHPYEEYFKGSINKFLYHDIGSLSTIIRFYNIWKENFNLPSDMIIMKYENLVNNTCIEFLNILRFLGINSPNIELVKSIVSENSFDNLRTKEEKNVYNDYSLKPGDKSDSESFKVRKGKIGGYVDYFDENEIKYLNDQIASKLDSIYKY
ncbi:MAG: sulfotransferase domain-containing protein [Cytophagales bacterium]